MEFMDSLKPTSRGESHMTLRQLIFEWCYSSVRLKLGNAKFPPKTYCSKCWAGK